MDKAFDTKVLGAMLKEKGLVIAEEGLLVLEQVLFQWIEESVKLTPSQMDDVAIPFLELLKPLVEAQIKKLDGK